MAEGRIFAGGRRFALCFLALVGVFALILPVEVWAAKAGPTPDMPEINTEIFGNRGWVWVIAQLHILFASFILGVPMFIVISEALYMKTGDYKYERLAHEVTKVVAFCYSLTALTGGAFALILFMFYTKFTYFIFYKFQIIWVLFYPIMFTLETVLMYVYYYSWNSMTGSNKKWHLLIGILLNVAGITTLFLMNAPASYMLTPPRMEDPTLWQNINNFTWLPLNFHRLIGNLTFGGYMVAIISAYMYFFSDSREDKEYYDWQGYIGNMIGVGAMIPLPIMGYIYSYEMYMYDASLGMYTMSDRLSMVFEVQAVLVGFLFVASNYYMWLSMKRISGAERFESWMKVNYVLIFFGAMIWFLPRHYFATMVPEPGIDITGTELPSHLGFLALMKAKNLAAIIICSCTLINFVLYYRAGKTGKIEWGKIDPTAQYVLIFLGFSDIWLMNLMGAFRELARKSYHVYNQVRDVTPEAFSPTLAYQGVLTTQITLVFFGIFSFIIWLMLKVGADKPKGEQA